jgi:DNA helicase-2/ATP-dependent DNA helicase PcrA
MAGTQVGDLFEGLNEAQTAAVSAPDGNHLVLAGAGSGKTRVLTRRIAWLNQELSIPLHQIVAVTFTNKAATEMKERLLGLLGQPASSMWVGTFHGLSHRILRMHPLEAGLPADFQILDSDDQVRMVKQVMEELDIDTDKVSAREASSWISRHKDDGLRPGQTPLLSTLDQLLRSVYSSYQERCDRLGLIDFAEILLRCQELFINHPALLSHYQKRFAHLLVDEFQDTNAVQYKWVASLLGQSGRGFVVADDSQAIYGWRGARVDNVLSFVDEYDASIWRLEQNYRSTSAILDAANALIANNPTREDFRKKLWTSQASGEAIKCLEVKTEVEEAELVAVGIAKAIAAGVPARECAILYRSNAQSRVMEESLLIRNIPYKIYGGHRFFDRQEVKDAVAYLRIASNRQDDVSFDRVINTPPRGIGSSTVDEISSLATQNGCSRWEACQLFVDDERKAVRARNAVSAFMDVILALDETSPADLEGRLRRIMQDTGLRAHHEKQSKGEANSRADNLDELVSVGARFRQPEEEIEMGWTPMQSFLAQVSLEPGDADSRGDKNADSVQLMTIHSAKGLEFDVVFLIGWEDGMFPSSRSMEEEDRLEEERRLAYVAITRARKKLAILHAKTRRIYGRVQEATASRFINEISDHLHKKGGAKPAACAPSSSPSSNPSSKPPIALSGGDFRPGQSVNHGKWGDGIVVRKDPTKGCLVAFRGVGAKWVEIVEIKVAK